MTERPDYVFTAAVGVETRDQFELIRDETVEARRGRGRMAVGLLGSEKTFLMGVSNRHGDLYPTFADAEAIARAAETSMGEDCMGGLDLLLHYNTDNPNQVSGQLLRGMLPNRDAYSGVQINGLSFEQAAALDLEPFLHRDQVVVMQVHSKLLAKLSPAELAAEVAKLRTIDYVWLDGSGGQGLPLDTEHLRPYVAALAEKTDVGIGVGGGLNADTVAELIPPLLAEYPHLSWDAQRGLHQQIDGIWHFDPEAAIEFLNTSAALRQEYTDQSDTPHF